MKRYSVFTYETGLGIICGLTIAFIIVLFSRMLSPLLCGLAREELQSIFNRICNEAVIDYIDLNIRDNSDIVHIDRAENGGIQGITTDTVKINKLKSEITLKIQKELDKIDEIKVKIPSGGFFGLGGGIDFPVWLMAVNFLETDIVTSFESVGINQTRLCVSAVINLSGELLAIGEGNTVRIKTEVPVFMTVIVGDVPGTYIDVKK